MSISRRHLLHAGVTLVSAGVLPWSIPTSVAQALQDEARPTDPAQLNADPVIRPDLAREIAPGVTAIPDPRINLVPNVGIVAGRDAVLVVDTGLGPENGRQVLDLAKRIAGTRPITLTLTHFHPEHAYGAQALRGAGRILVNQAQAEELALKGPSYLELFRTFGPGVAKALEGTEIVRPDDTYEGERVLDLGGRKATLIEMPAHTRGDQIVHLPEEGIVFAGDLVENRFFPIFPDADAKGAAWIAVLKRIEALQPRIVVPGHGAVSDVNVVRAVREYLEQVQAETAALAKAGVSDEEADRRLTPVVRARYPNWDNPVWIPFAIRVFHAEATGKPLNLPKL